MLKRMAAIVKRDLMSGFRDSLILYILISPLVIAVLFRLFIPNLNMASIQFSVLESDTALIAHLQQYGAVETFTTQEKMEDRVRDIDDSVGVVDKNGEYVMILEGNESEEIANSIKYILYAYDGFGDMPIKVNVSDIGWKISLLGSIGIISLIMFSTVLGGMLSGLNIVEERQARTIRAMHVSPASTMEFLIAKCVQGVVIPIIQSILVFFIMGYTDINWMMMMVLCIFSSLIGLIVGILLGVMNNDPLTAVAGLKILFLPISVTLLGALLLPKHLQFLLYWIPYYWTYQGVNSILLKTAVWPEIIMYSGILTGITLLVFILLKGKIRKGLSG